MSQTQASKRERHAGTRTCVGCGVRVDRAAAAAELVRVVFAPLADGGFEAVVDLGGSLEGRGAWLHPRRDCVLKAQKSGLARAAKARVQADGLATQIAMQAGRRAMSLIAAATRARAVHVGSQAVTDALRDPHSGVVLVVVACDAAAAAKQPEVVSAFERGEVVAWSTKEQLGALFNRATVGVLAIADQGIARALRDAVAMAASFAQQIEDHD